MDIIAFGIFLFICYLTGSTIEKKHFARIIAREKALLEQPYVSDNYTALDQDKIADVKLVTGSCVVAADRFKVFLGGLRSLFGGNVSAYESLTERARREAILRMREQAPDADMIVQTRISLSELGKARVETLSYGTAVYLRHEPIQTD